ncbi:MAG: BamA/TamA family outer membrane protein [Verrucomicrobiota bacterium]
MRKYAIKFLCLVLLGLAYLAPANAATIMVDTNGQFTPTSFLLPYAFYNEHFGFAAGAAYGASGWLQPQMSYVVSAMAGTSGSGAAYFLGKDIQMPFCDRLFLDPWLSAGYFQEQNVFIDGNPKFPNQQAGSNGSSDNNYVSGSGSDFYGYLTFKYLLPLGADAEEPITKQVVDRGMLVSGATGGSTWNPLKSGLTEIQLQPFSRQQTVDSKDVTTDNIRTTGLTTALAYDNRDFAPNPSIGSYQRVGFSRDFGWPDSTASWSVIDATFNKFFSLGATEHLRQQVLALSFWTADSLTWDEHNTPTGTVINHRAPNFAGATLGGLYRMRGYPSGRFSDKAAIYYCAEYRVIPDWNPLNSIPYVKKLNSDWIQAVAFVETGRVAPEWNIDTLHSSMKWDAGLGLRVMVKRLIGRIDMAYSPEGANVQMMVGQPF